MLFYAKRDQTKHTPHKAVRLCDLGIEVHTTIIALLRVRQEDSQQCEARAGLHSECQAKQRYTARHVKKMYVLKQIKINSIGSRELKT